MKQIAIIHFNTPELTVACIKSIRKHGCFWPVNILDNSNERPFTEKMQGVKVLDNTKGQIIDFDAELAKFPNKNEYFCNGVDWPSAKHMLSVQKLWELLPGGFLLVESDILIKKDIRCLWDERYAAVGGRQAVGGLQAPRLLPMLCYLNVPLLTKHGAKYFDPKRTFGLLADAKDKNNWYDTGAVVLEDIVRTKPALVALLYTHITHFYEHFRHGSWRDNKLQAQKNWLEQNRQLWTLPREDVKSEQCAVCAMGRMENRYAVEFVKHYKKIGFDKVFIYDNNRSMEEKFADVLGDFINNGFVEVSQWPHYGQTHDAAFNDCYAKHGNEYQWILFVDFDEFLQLPKGKTIRKVMSEYEFADIVMINWQVMTDGNLVTDDGRDCAKRFKTPIADDLKRTDGLVINEHVKSMVRGGIKNLQFKWQPHVPASPKLRCVNVENEVVNQYPLTKPTASPIRIRHYMTKTIEEYMNIKAVRLFANGDKFNESWLKTAVNDFWLINEKTPEKKAWLESRDSKPKA